VPKCKLREFSFLKRYLPSGTIRVSLFLTSQRELPISDHDIKYSLEPGCSRNTELLAACAVDVSAV